MVDSNLICYMDDKIVDSYRKGNYLDKPEVMFLYKFEEELKSKRMLDIGIGGGRTTRYFAHRVNKYIGIDYSKNMVEACQTDFPDLTFMQCDVRNMQIFEDNSFDFVLFSYNGIDYIDHNDRLNALQEIRRVCNKSDGIFFFSSHNFNYISNLFSFRISRDPIITIFNLYNYLLLKFKNMNIKYNEGYTIIKDGAGNFRLSTYYVTPDEQIVQLINVGFKNIGMYHLNSGTEITTEMQNDFNPWIHYLCRS